MMVREPPDLNKVDTMGADELRGWLRIVLQDLQEERRHIDALAANFASLALELSMAQARRQNAAEYAWPGIPLYLFVLVMAGIVIAWQPLWHWLVGR